MTFGKFIDSFRSGARHVHVAREFVPSFVPTGRTSHRTYAAAAARLTARGSVSISRFGVSTPEDIEERRKKVISCDFSVAD